MSNFTITRWHGLLGRPVFPDEDNTWSFSDKEQAEEECKTLNDMYLLINPENPLKYTVQPITHMPSSPGTRSSVCDAQGKVEESQDTATCPICHKEVHGTISFSF
jgi:hypothetical protein